MSPLWDQITLLTNELKSSLTKVKKRREVGDKLIDLLSRDSNRKRLAEEAIAGAQKSGRSLAKARVYGLSVAWTPIISSAIYSAERIASGTKIKLTESDVRLPLRLLQLSDKSYDASSSVMHDSGNRIKLESTCKLSETDVKKVFKYCKDMLDNDVAAQLAETDLLETLYYLCSHVDYVAYFTPETQLMEILSIVEPFLFQKNTSIIAAKIMGAAMENFFELGISLHLVLPLTLTTVSKWCKRNIDSVTTGQREFCNLLRAVTALLRFHPEQAVAPMSRYGHNIMGFAKRSYPNADGITRHTIHNYFLAHLLVCQMAGKQRGLFPGDLGDLGVASLTKKQINALLTLVMSSLLKIELSISTKNRTLWKPLESHHRLHLELCARLLACAQRQFFVETEWNRIENHDSFLVKVVKESGRGKDEIWESTLTWDKVSNQLETGMDGSPWMTRVIDPILRVLPSRKQTMCNNDNVHMNGQASLLNSSEDIHIHVLDRQQSPHGQASAVDSKLIRPLLMVISACAEAFPAGSCWTCSARKHWHSILPRDTLADDILNVQSCSTRDLALVVDLLAQVLEAYGGSTGDQELQILAVLCLIRLTEVHTMISHLLRDKTEDKSHLVTAWKSIWTTLLRPDLRYSAYSENSDEGSCGELVLVLLAELVQRGCTDPETENSQLASRQTTFIYQQQSHVWGLPVFNKGSSVKTAACFELAYVLLQNVGLSDAGSDKIGHSRLGALNELMQDRANHEKLGRRFRLLCFCLDALKSVQPLNSTAKQRVLSAAAACTVAIVHGEACSRGTTFNVDSRNKSWSRSAKSADDTQHRFNFTELPDTTACSFPMASGDIQLECFYWLWETPLPDPECNYLMQHRLLESVRMDCVLATRKKLCEIACLRDRVSAHADFVPETISATLQGVVQGQLKAIERLVSGTDVIQDDESPGADDEDAAAGKPKATQQCSLAEQVLWVKVLLNTSASFSDDVDLVSCEIASLMQRISSGLPALCGDVDEFRKVFSGVLQILLTVGRLLQMKRMNLTSSVTDVASSFLASLEAVLIGFSGGALENRSGWDEKVDEEFDDEEEMVDRSELRDARNDFSMLDDSDDDDEAVNRRLAAKKRKLVEEELTRKRKLPGAAVAQRKRAKSTRISLDADCAYLVSSIILVLEPSFEKCDVIIHNLLGCDEEHTDAEVDPCMAFYCSCILSWKSIHFHDHAVRRLDGMAPDDFRQSSLIVKFCKVLRSLRISSSPSSTLYMFGFQKVAEIVEIGESESRGMPLTAEESKNLINILLPNDKGIAHRPYLRTDRLRGATAAFEVATETFHASFDAHFPKSFVLPSLRDLSAHVRKDACLAVAAAMRAFPDPSKIVNSVLRWMPPIACPAEERQEFRDWYQHKDLGSGKIELENRIWEDAYASMEACAIECRAVIAGLKSEFTSERLYELVQLSSLRPDLEAQCFHACGKIACMLGYTTAEDLIADESDGIIQRWLKTGESIAGIPLLLSSPSVIRHLLVSGQQQLLHTGMQGGSSTDSTNAHVDVQNLKDVATDDFVAKHRSFIFPQILLKIASEDSKKRNVDLSPSELTSHRKSLLLENRLLEEFSVCLKDRHDEDTMKYIFQSRHDDLAAFCEPMLHAGLEDLANEMMQLSQAILSNADGASDVPNKPHQTIKQILELSGKGPALFSTAIGHEAFSEAILTLLDPLGKSGKADILAAAGTSATESLLLARQWLEQAQVSFRIEWRWSTITLVSEMIVAHMRRGEKNSQLGFYVNVMVDILLNPGLACIHQCTLAALKQVLQDLLPNIEMVVLRDEMALVYRRLVGACMKAHEENQRVFLEGCAAMAKSSKATYLGSLGLLRGSEVQGTKAAKTSSDAWGWEVAPEDSDDKDSDSLKDAVREFGKKMTRQTRETMIGTYDLLEILFDNATKLGLRDDCFVGAKPPFSLSRKTQEAISVADPRFCAQRLSLQFMEEPKNDVSKAGGFVNESSVLSILKSLKNHSSWMETFRSRQGQGQRLSMSQWMIKAELVQMEEALRKQRGAGRPALHADMTEFLIRELAFVCGAPCPDALRSAAARCIGEFDLCDVRAHSLSLPATTSLSVRHDRGVRGIQAQCITVLGEFLYSAKSGVAISSCNTLLALLASREGADCWELLGDDTRRLLQPLKDSKKRHSKDKKLPLPKSTLMAIKRRAGVDAESPVKDPSWCWAKDLWTINSDFESWICCLVPALIECCYGEPDERNKGQGNFFRISQNISAFAPVFARTIFPAIVLDLLERKDDCKSPKTSSIYSPVFLDTWLTESSNFALEGFSQGFETLLLKAVASSEDDSFGGKASFFDNRALELIVDTVDLLRRTSQHRFLLSESHRRNSNAIPSPSNNDTKSDKKSAKKSTKSSRTSSVSPPQARDALVYNQGLGDGVQIWKGIPYGTVLRLDGHLFVKACLLLKREASALFYLELFMDSFFGESGGIMEKLSNDFTYGSLKARQYSTCDISGYHTNAASCDPTVIRQRALASSSLLGKCFLALHEGEAVQATKRQTSDLHYSGDALIEDDREESMLSPSLAELQRLDTLSSMNLRPLTRIIRTMEALGLPNLLQTYIGGLKAANASGVTESDKLILREKFYESKLFGMQWLDLTSRVEEGSIPSQSTKLMHESSEIGELHAHSGFHESISEALAAYSRDDFRSCRLALTNARASLLVPVSSIGTSEASLAGLPDIVERLQSLNDLDQLSLGDSIDHVLKRWGFSFVVDTDGSRRPSGSESDDDHDVSLNASFIPGGVMSLVIETVLQIARLKSRERPIMESFDPHKCLVAHLWEVTSKCRKIKRHPDAEAAMLRLRTLLNSDKLSETAVLRQRLEEACLLESKGDFTGAIRVTRQIISRLSSREHACPGSEGMLVDSMFHCGKWLSKFKVLPAKQILCSYHKPGAEKARSIYKQCPSKVNEERYLNAMLALAQLASNLYESVSARIKSLDWVKAGRRLAERVSELKGSEDMLAESTKLVEKARRKAGSQNKEVERLLTEQRELRIYCVNLRKEVQLCSEERSKTEVSVREHLKLAVKSYVKALSISAVSEGVDMSRHLFRMIHLWLSTCSEGSGDEDINTLMKAGVKSIPSYRFVPLTSQLFAHIEDDSHSKFQATLRELIVRMCSKHPYHCLVQLISMSNGKEVGSGVSGRNATAFLENVSNSKVDAANSIITELKTKKPDFIGKLIENYQSLMSAYIALAMAPTDDLVQRQQTKKIPFSSLPVWKNNSQRLDKVLSKRLECPPCVLTKPPLLRPGGDYGEGQDDPIGGERALGFESDFSITDSGLHRPKIVMCIGSRGSRFRQLVKGEDEIRQDAVMEQVFTYVNDLFRRRGRGDLGEMQIESSESSKGKCLTNPQELRVMTYNIIPLSPASGVLEWVENSMTFGDYLLDVRDDKRGHNLGAHSRYYPGEWGNARCREHFRNSPKEILRQTFDIICQNCSPAFRFFFVERFGHSLQAWYGAKMKFTRSVAVSSLVGHYLGIGDRHASNILISQLTGEVIHIDFGIVFEQGKLLNVPEVVPFRLTRNLVDGMGPTGTEGTFTKAAEATAEVLRENANALLTILSAIASDPLYSWSVSPVEARRRQKLTDDDGAPAADLKDHGETGQTESKSDRNEAAALVLNKISEKLQGYEDGTSGEQQSVEGQVQLLINSARDPENLCVMFSGWAPWI